MTVRIRSTLSAKSEATRRCVKGRQGMCVLRKTRARRILLFSEFASEAFEEGYRKYRIRLRHAVELSFRPAVLERQREKHVEIDIVTAAFSTLPRLSCLARTDAQAPVRKRRGEPG